MTTQPSLFTRSDTIFGACEGIGEDFGFNAQYLRVALGGMMFWNPVAALGTYAALAVTVFASRKLFPTPRTAAPAETPAIAAPQPVRADNESFVELAAAA